MDQSTQVNFPIVEANHRKILRHNTSADLYSTQTIRNLSGPLSNSWTQLKSLPPRPKSLHVSLEAFNRSKFSNFESPAFNPPSHAFPTPSHAFPAQGHALSVHGHASRSLYPAFDTPPGSISRERTPPFSCSSSVASNGFSRLPGGQSKGKPNAKEEESSSSASIPRCYCRCMDSRVQRQLSKTPEGLSWRRLHMSRAKLKATATTSELLSGFAMIAMVELQINTPTNVPEWLFVMFAVCTTVLVAVHIFALMISTYILPNVEAVAKLDVCEMVGESPHERMRGFIELAWAFSTILGLFLFLVEVAILCWVKFWDYSFTAAVAATVIVVPVLVIFVLFVVHFYHSLVVYKCISSVDDMEKLEDMKKHLDEVQMHSV